MSRAKLIECKDNYRHRYPLDDCEGNESIISKCKGCLNITAMGKCSVIIDPYYFFKKYGECFARCDIQEAFKRRKAAIENYHGKGMIQ